MQSIIDKAISLRKAGQYHDSRALLIPLLDTDFSAQTHLHIAWSYDNESKEQEAIKHYESALDGLLSNDERFDALFGAACTHRCLGHYKKALRFFETVLSEYPTRDEAKPFYAMCLYNVGEHKKAIQILLELLLRTTNKDVILNYKEAIAYYAQDLDARG